MINYDTVRGGIAVETEPSPRTQSKLTILDATEADSGNYTCSAPNTLPASILVFVSEGKTSFFEYLTCKKKFSSEVPFGIVSKRAVTSPELRLLSILTDMCKITENVKLKYCFAFKILQPLQQTVASLFISQSF